MEHIIKQLKKGAKHTRLSSAEKAEMRSMLLRHVKTNPVRTEMFERQQFVKGNRSILSPFQINNLRSKKTMPILVILGLLMGGSASFAAENALPGDVLFPVKVHVNESVRGAVAVTSKAKAEWGIRLVERRLEEVEKLVTKTDVSEETRQIASTNLGEYTERVHGRIAKFEEDDDSDDAILTAGELADLLRAHEEVLVGLSTQVAGAVATSTGAVMATTTAVTATSTASADTSLIAGTQSLGSILAQLRAGRGDAEKKHKELKRKYHREDDDEDEDKDGDENEDDDDTPRAWMPTSVTGAVTSTTTNATVGTSTSAIQMVAPTVSPVSRKSSDRKEREERHEEVRATVGITPIVSATGGATTTPANIVPTEHTERSADSDSSDSRDGNDDD